MRDARGNEFAKQFRLEFRSGMVIDRYARAREAHTHDL